MTPKAIRLLGILGCTLLISYAVLFLILGKDHFSLLACSLFCVAIAYTFSEREGSDRVFDLESNSLLKLPSRVLAPVTRYEGKSVFLMEKGKVGLFEEGNLKTCKLNTKFQAMSPICSPDGFLVWGAGCLFILDWELNPIRIEFRGKGLSLARFLQDRNQYLLGSTAEEIMLLDFDGTFDRQVVLGVPHSYEEGLILTSYGNIYHFDGDQWIQDRDYLGEVLGVHWISGPERISFDLKARIYREREGKQEFLDYYHRDFGFPIAHGKNLYYVSRARKLVGLQLGDSPRDLLDLKNSPTWMKNFGSFLLILEPEKKMERLYCLNMATSSLASFPLESEFEPLGIRGSSFEFRDGDSWYTWNLKENSPERMESKPPFQCLYYKDQGIRFLGKSWVDLQANDLDCPLEPRDNNYDFQESGWIPVI